ncbi:MAG: MerR family transcriptional regulator [Erysipelotrichaceae bacterium]
MQKENLYRIGLFAQMSHLTVKTLHFYQSKGLLLPVLVDEENGYRHYSSSQLIDVSVILALKEAGFTIDQIKEYLDNGCERKYLENLKVILLNRLAKTTDQLSKLQQLIGQDDDTLYPVVLTTIEKAYCCCYHSSIDNYQQLAEVMCQFGQLMEEAGCKCSQDDYCFTCYCQKPQPDQKIEVMVCQKIDSYQKDVEGLLFKEFDSEQMATIYHKGSYNSLAKSYNKLIDYLTVNELEITSDIREVYIDGIWNKDDESQWLTQIQIPVGKKQ